MTATCTISCFCAHAHAEGGLPPEAAELPLCPAIFCTGSFAPGTLKLQTPTCFMSLLGCRFPHTFCLLNPVRSSLFTSALPVTDLETAAVHLKVMSCVLKETNKQEVRIRREFCFLVVSILHVICWEIHPRHLRHVSRLCLSATWDESFIHSLFICNYKAT